MPEIEEGCACAPRTAGHHRHELPRVDYVDPKTNPILPISWEPDNLYIPGARSTVTQFVAAASDILDRLRKIDIDGTMANLNKLLVTTNNRIEAVDAAKISDQTKQVLGKLETKLDQLPMDQIGKDGAALLAELRQSNQKLAAILDDPALKRLPGDADAALVGARKLVEDPNLASTIAHLQRTVARLDRIIGGGEADLSKTLENLRQISDNLRELTENAKRHRRACFSRPPPVKGAQ